MKDAGNQLCEEMKEEAEKMKQKDLKKKESFVEEESLKILEA